MLYINKYVVVMLHYFDNKLLADLDGHLLLLPDEDELLQVLVISSKAEIFIFKNCWEAGAHPGGAGSAQPAALELTVLPF